MVPGPLLGMVAVQPAGPPEFGGPLGVTDAGTSVVALILTVAVAVLSRGL